MPKLSDYIQAYIDLGGHRDPTVTEGEVWALLERDDRAASGDATPEDEEV